MKVSGGKIIEDDAGGKIIEDDAGGKIIEDDAHQSSPMAYVPISGL
jgi:hypothetical protein